MHVAVYKNRRDVNAVIHSDQVYASIFSILNVTKAQDAQIARKDGLQQPR
jgi:ribulose-5-phosphate 4-epimerase/fuculose-1-phosphate aldolase